MLSRYAVALDFKNRRVWFEDPARAAAHFRRSLQLSHNPYDLGYYLADCLRARRQQKGQTP